MVPQVAIEVGRRFRLVAGAEPGRRGAVEANPAEAAGSQDGGDMPAAGVLLHRRAQRGIDLKGDFVKDHGCSDVTAVTSSPPGAAYASNCSEAVCSLWFIV